MNKKGFVFIETIVTVVVLSASLLLLYNSYSKSIEHEKERLYYDDVAFIYETNYIRNFLIKNSNIETIVNYAFDNTYIQKIGPEWEGMFTQEQINNHMKASFENIISAYKINQMLLIDTDYITDCFNPSGDIKTKCESSEMDLSLNVKNYIKTLNSKTADFYLIIEYTDKINEDTNAHQSCTPGIDTKCIAIYSSLELKGSASNTVPSGTLADVCKDQNLASCVANNYKLDRDIYYHDANLANSAEDNSYRYSGANPNNYVCFGSDEEICPTDNLYRIIGVFGNQIKLIKYDYANSDILGTGGDYNTTIYTKSNFPTYKGEKTSLNTYRWNYKKNNAASYDWAISLLNTENLNSFYLNKLGSKWANMIADTNWNIGESTYVALAKEIYNAEKTKQTTTKSKIGLMNISDYGFATSPNNWSEKLHTYNLENILHNNWMYMGVDEWTITMSYSSGNYVVCINDPGSPILSDDHLMTSMSLRPAFYLNTNVKLVSGEGTTTNPYRIN